MSLNAFGYFLTEQRAILGAPYTYIDLDAFQAFLRRLGFDTACDHPQPDAEDDLLRGLSAAELGR